MVRAFAISLCAINLCACTVTRDVDLYPVGNAVPTPALHGQLKGHGFGNGMITIAMPDGQSMRGTYSIVFDSQVSFGSIFGSVYGRNGLVSGSATASNISMSGEGEGLASLAAADGTTMDCEFLNANLTGHGYGACRTSKGVTYRMIY